MTRTKKKINANRDRDKKLSERLDKLEARTIPNQKVAAADRSMAAKVKKQPLPTTPHAHAMLTEEEAEYHSALRGGTETPKPLINNNIEDSGHSQSFRSDYLVAVTANDYSQVTVISAVDSQVDSDTPKGFWSTPVLGVDGAGLGGSPGPTTEGGATPLPAAGVLHADSANPTPGVMMATTLNASGYMAAVPPVNPCPFVSPDNDQAAALRWQLVKLRVKVINTTSGQDRGGVGYIIQPTNRPRDLAGTRVAPMQFAARGIFKTLNNCETKSSDDDWVTLDVRDGLCAYHACGSGGSTDLTNSALFLYFDRSGAAPQTLRVYIQLHWSLAGTVVRGIAAPHVVCAQAADRAAETNMVMRNSNIVPSEQRGKEHIAAAMALHSSPALQAMTAVAAHSPLHYATKAVHDIAHPAVKLVKQFAGRHLPRLVEAGLTGLAKRALESAGK